MPTLTTTGRWGFCSCAIATSIALTSVRETVDKGDPAGYNIRRLCPFWIYRSSGSLPLRSEARKVSRPKTPQKAKERREDVPGEHCSYALRFQVLQNSLTRAEGKIGRYFLDHPEAAHLSVTDVVQESGVGYGSIMRFCQKMGCSGFQGFKVLLAQDLGRSAFQAHRAKAGSIMEYAVSVKGQLTETAKLLNLETVSSVAQALNRAGHVLIGGIAGSAALAAGFDYRLSRIGIHSSAVCEGYTLSIRAACLGPKDLFFAVSFSGATKDVIAAAGTAKERGACVVSLTGFMRAPVVDLADYSLFGATNRDPLSCEVFSNISSDFVLDVIFNRLYEIRRDASEVVKRTFEAISDRRV